VSGRTLGPANRVLRRDLDAHRPTAKGTLDLQIEMLPINRTRLPEWSPGELVTGDTIALPFSDASFDVVFVATVLGEVPVPGGAVEEVRRVLRPEGIAPSVAPFLLVPEHRPSGCSIVHEGLAQRVGQAPKVCDMFMHRPPIFRTLLCHRLPVCAPGVAHRQGLTVPADLFKPRVSHPCLLQKVVECGYGGFTACHLSLTAGRLVPGRKCSESPAGRLPLRRPITQRPLRRRLLYKTRVDDIIA
jgi:hypothetical protein